VLAVCSRNERVARVGGGRVLEDPVKTLELALRTGRGWTNSERDVLRRAKKEGVYSLGRLTDEGKRRIKRVEEAKASLRVVLAGEEAIERSELRVRLGSMVSDAAAEAAIFDLEGDGELRREETTCACGQSRIVVARGPRWQAPS
jgi:hypothetical protein